MRSKSPVTTTPIPDEIPVEPTTNDNIEEPRENKNTKVSDEALTTESIIISTTLSHSEPFTEMITTINVPTSTAGKAEVISTAKMLTSSTEKTSSTITTTNVPTPTTNNIRETMSTTKAPTSTLTNIITSIYEAATERQRVRVKNIQNFLMEHKKTELVTKSIVEKTTQLSGNSPTTVENIITSEEPTPKSILKGRLGQAHFRPTLRKPIITSEKISSTTENIVETTTEKKFETTTEKKFRLNRYTNRFVRPTTNNTQNESITSKRFIRPTTESSLESNTRQFNRFRQTTSSTTTTSSIPDNSTPFSRRSLSRFKLSTTEASLTSSAEIPKSRFFRSRKPISSSTSTLRTIPEEATIKELLNVEENMNTVRFETTYIPTTISFPTTMKNDEEISTDEGEFKVTTIENFEPTKYNANEITTKQSITVQSPKTFRGSVRANVAHEDDTTKRSRSPSSGRQNSRFLKDEQKILYIKVMPSPDGRSQNEFTSHPVKNVTRNRGSIRAFDSLELVTLADGLTNDERPNELFRGSETKFRVQQSSTVDSTEEV